MTEAKNLGLAKGLHVERLPYQYRCSACNKMQKSGSPRVPVPVGVRVGDPIWSVEEEARLSAYNGEWDSWCLECARSFSQEEAKWWRLPPLIIVVALWIVLLLYLR